MNEPSATANLLPEKDLADLREAVVLLEQDTFTEAVLNVVGTFIGGGLDGFTRFIPESFRGTATDRLADLLEKAFDQVLLTVDRDRKGLTGRRWLDAPLSSSWIDGASAILTGALGGAGGLATTAIELPVTTAFLMRAIAQIAAREGEDLRSGEGKLECLKVFALGGRSPSDDGVDRGYYSVRLFVSQALPHMMEKALPKLLAKVAERFSVTVSTKVAGQAVPGVGAAAGALINLAFVDHFQRKALGHFRVRRLERTYGAENIQAIYGDLRREWLAAKATRKGGEPAPKSSMS